MPGRMPTPRQFRIPASTRKGPARPVRMALSGLLLLLLCLFLAQTAPADPLKGAAARNFSTCLVNFKETDFGNLRCLPTASLRSLYDRTKGEMEELRNHKVRACWRQPWEELRDTFVSIAISRPVGNLAAQALYRAGECQEALARCSRLGEDYRMAQGLYEGVVHVLPTSVRADDALLAAARIAATNLQRPAEARDYANRILEKYPSSDSAGPARELLASLGKVSLPATASLTNVIWSSPETNCVEVVLDFSRPTRVSARLERDRKQTRIVMDLGDVDVVSEIRRGLSVRNSLLQTISVQQPTRTNTRLVLAFSGVDSYSTKQSGKNRVVLSVRKKNGRAVAVKKGGSAPVSTRTAGLGILRENSIRVVTIDAGHGGVDPGTLHNGIVERNITLDVALRLGRLLTDNGIRVIYTRKGNRTVSLARRTALANENRSDLFVSVHVNAHTNPSVSGVEVYYLDTSASQSRLVADRENGSKKNIRASVRKAGLDTRILASRRLAQDTHRKLVSRLRRNGYTVTDKGVKTGPFFVLATAAMPSVLAEIGYCSNRDEAELLKQEDYRQAIAEGLAEGILAYRDRSLDRVTAEQRSGRKTAIQ